MTRPPHRSWTLLAAAMASSRLASKNQTKFSSVKVFRLHPNPTIGVITIHRTGNNMDHASTQELPARGFVTLGMNTHATNNEAALQWDEHMSRDVKAGVEYLYNEVGMEKVVLLGHSGGGPTTSFYQAIAEKGLGICQGSNKIVECPNDERLIGPSADAIIFMDTHPGNPVNRLRSWNPAVRSESNPGSLATHLNPFLEKNGDSPDGCSSYSEDFKQRYFEAQSERGNRLTRKALSIKSEMEAGRHFPADDDSFVVYHDEARLADLDNSIDARTLSPRKLLTDDRDIVTGIVETVRACDPQLKEEDLSYEGARAVTINSFLGTHAIRSTHSMDDVDHCSSNNSTTCMVRYIEIPTLVATAQGHYFMRDNEEIFELSASANKDFVVIEGATHGTGNCDSCDGAPYVNATRNFYDYIAKWMNTGFTPVTELP